jgi:hypothetical protein
LSGTYTFTHHPALSGFSDANNAGVSRKIFLDLALINKVLPGQTFSTFHQQLRE